MIISFEGVDNTGKTTQIKKLCDYFVKNNIKHFLYREPGGTFLGNKIRKIIKEVDINKVDSLALFFLFLSSRRQLVKKIKNIKNEIIILDRYVDSSIVYQGYIGKICIQKIKEFNSLVIEDNTPDLTFIFIKKHKILSKKNDTFSLSLNSKDKEINFAYKKLLENKESRFVEINANQSIQSIHEQIISIIKSRYAQYFS